MSTHMMNTDTRCYLAVSCVKNHLPFVHVPHHIEHMIHRVGTGKIAMSHMWAGRILHLKFLQVKSRGRKIIE